MKIYNVISKHYTTCEDGKVNTEDVKTTISSYDNEDDALWGMYIDAQDTLYSYINDIDEFDEKKIGEYSFLIKEKSIAISCPSQDNHHAIDHHNYTIQETDVGRMEKRVYVIIKNEIGIDPNCDEPLIPENIYSNSTILGYAYDKQEAKKLRESLIDKEIKNSPNIKYDRIANILTCNNSTKIIYYNISELNITLFK